MAPKAASFRDDFDRTTLAGWTVTPVGGAARVSLVGGRLAVVPHVDYTQVRAPGTYDMTSSAVAVEVDPSGPSANHEAYLVVANAADTDEVFTMYVDAEEALGVNHAPPGGSGAWYAATFPYDPVAHRWWRILELDGTVAYQVSPDGALWETLATHAHSLDMSSAVIELQAGLYGAQTAQPPVHFDNFNVLRYGSTTERLYARLPEAYRVADLEHDLALKRFASVIVDQASLLERLVDRVPTDLADPVLAEDEWLDWLAQLVGVSLARNLTEAQRRDAVRFSSSGWRAGTRDAMADAAKSELTGTKYVAIIDHTTDVSNPGTATQWDVLVKTRGSETPTPTAVLAAIVSKNAKPAGIKLYHRTYDASWTTLETLAPTWNAIEARGTWDNVQETGL